MNDYVTFDSGLFWLDKSLLMWMVVRRLIDGKNIPPEVLYIDGKEITSIKQIADIVAGNPLNILNLEYRVDKRFYDDVLSEVEEVLGSGYANGFTSWIYAQEKVMEDYKETLKDFYANTPLTKRVFHRMVAIIAEAVETMNETPWRYWREDTGKIDKEKLMEELADMFHFVAEVLIELKIPPTNFLAMFYAKNTINMLRQIGLANKDKGFVTRELNGPETEETIS